MKLTSPLPASTDSPGLVFGMGPCTDHDDNDDDDRGDDRGDDDDYDDYDDYDD